jgi:hypothetical protein
MELWRIPVISVIASLCGIMFYLISEAFFPEADAGSPLELWIFVLFMVWLVSTVLSCVLGILLHLATHQRNLPSGVLLLLFVATAGTTAWVISQSPGISTHLQFLGVGTGVSAWAMYCYGPFKLWRRTVREA